MTARLEGRRCLVTGATGGQGAAVSRRFAFEGARVAVTDLSEDRVASLADELRRTGRDAVGIAGDVRDEGQVEAVIQAVVEAFGGLDVLYNNAGVLLPDSDAPVEQLERAVWDEVLATNATSVFLFCKHAVPHLLAAAPGSVILNVGSVASYAGDEDALGPILDATALRRFGQPEEIAAYAAFLASTEASFVTSSLVTVHGGLLPS